MSGSSGGIIPPLPGSASPFSSHSTLHARKERERRGRALSPFSLSHFL